MTNLNLSRPEPLTELLDRGGDPRAQLGDRGFRLIVERVEDHSLHSPQQRARWAGFTRCHVQASLSGKPLKLVLRDGRLETIPPIVGQDELDLDSWTADLLDDFLPLSAKLLEFASPQVRARVARNLHIVDHPHPLGVDAQQRRARCAGCGDRFDDGALAMTIGHQRDSAGDLWSEPVDGAWCLGCVAIAYEALEAARG